MEKKNNVRQILKSTPFVVKTYRTTKRAFSITKNHGYRLIQIKNVPKWRRYQQYFLNQQLDKSDYVPITDKPYTGKSNKKLIAYYLPQFYRIPQNDAWFGPGFTEWSNASKAVPQYIGHWQPHLPIDVGFYNLETTHAMHRQVELAKMYGISGFCFYYYWFSGGDKIMEKPLKNWLEDKSLDFPFMFFWANEDWTNTWGAQADIGTKTYSAKMKPYDIKKFVKDILPYLKDSRYIKINGRPHVIIYQPKKDPFLPEFILKIGAELKKFGVARPYISYVFPDDFDNTFDPRNFGGDAGVEFGSHLKKMPAEIPEHITHAKLMNPLAKLTEYDMKTYIESEEYIFSAEYPVFKGAMTNFDNTARKIYKGAQIFSITPDLYRRWLSGSLADSKTDYIFVTAWNEWAEGMHLEPDQRYGYAYLQATKDALEQQSTLDNR